MSLKFNDTTNKNGIIQQIESNCSFKDGEITGNTTSLKKFTADCNLALDKVISLILKATGKWQFDDENFLSATTKYPVLKVDIVQGQRQYPFTADADGNLVLSIYRVFRKNQSGIYEEIFPVDKQSDENMQDFYDGLDVQGIPQYYDKTGGVIDLSPLPSYNSTLGLKVYISREGSYFTTADTTKKPGFAGIYHGYIPLCVSYWYCVRKKMFDLAKFYKSEMLEMEKEIKVHYRDRNRDEDDTITAERINAV